MFISYVYQKVYRVFGYVSLIYEATPLRPVALNPITNQCTAVDAGASLPT